LDRGTPLMYGAARAAAKWRSGVTAAVTTVDPDTGMEGDQRGAERRGRGVIQPTPTAAAGS